MPARKYQDGGKMHYDFWSVAIGSKVLGNAKLIDQLGTYSPENLHTELMLRVKETIDANADFTEANINKACKAAKGIFKWLMALVGYYYIYEECKPKRDALMLSTE